MEKKIRVAQADWDEECKKLHRRGLSVKAMRPDGDEFVVTVEPRVEVRAHMSMDVFEAHKLRLRQQNGGDAA